jgi:hypothetical protein
MRARTRRVAGLRSPRWIRVPYVREKEEEGRVGRRPERDRAPRVVVGGELRDGKGASGLGAMQRINDPG